MPRAPRSERRAALPPPAGVDSRTRRHRRCPLNSPGAHRSAFASAGGRGSSLLPEGPRIGVGRAAAIPRRRAFIFHLRRRAWFGSLAAVGTHRDRRGLLHSPALTVRLSARVWISLLREDEHAPTVAGPAALTRDGPVRLSPQPPGRGSVLPEVGTHRSRRGLLPALTVQFSPPPAGVVPGTHRSRPRRLPGADHSVFTPAGGCGSLLPEGRHAPLSAAPPPPALTIQFSPPPAGVVHFSQRVGTHRSRLRRLPFPGAGPFSFTPAGGCGSLLPEGRHARLSAAPAAFPGANRSVFTPAGGCGSLLPGVGTHRSRPRLLHSPALSARLFTAGGCNSLLPQGRHAPLSAAPAAFPFADRSVFTPAARCGSLLPEGRHAPLSAAPPPIPRRWTVQFSPPAGGCVCGSLLPESARTAIGRTCCIPRR